MKTILIEVPTRGNITPYEIHRAIANREEYLAGFTTQIPTKPKYTKPLPIKSNAGLYSFFRSVLP